MILDINKITNQVKDELDKVAINTEVLENLNKLINDKLDNIRDLDLSQPKEALLGSIWALTRYSECYTTLNYLQTKEIDKINDSITTMFNKIKQIEDLLKNITPLNDNKGGVINE
ncbi:MAG: hypothetical protein IJ094_07945 [Bacilli bacterium]|nr:hypothetical protein [Bacilli bacterium]